MISYGIIYVVFYLHVTTVIDTLVQIEELCTSLLSNLTDLSSFTNGIEFVSLTQKLPRTLTGGAIQGGVKCSGGNLQSVHAGEDMEALCKLNLLVSEANISPYLAKLVFFSYDMSHPSIVQPESPLFHPFVKAEALRTGRIPRTLHA
jgi:hypothetical protein